MAILSLFFPYNFLIPFLYFIYLQFLSASSNLDIGRDDRFLSKFLSYKHWDVEKAVGSIYAYYNFKEENPDWMVHHPVEYFREEFLDIKAKFIMPQPDKEGRPIVVFKMGK